MGETVMRATVKKILPSPVRWAIRRAYNNFFDTQAIDAAGEFRPGPGWLIHPQAYNSRWGIRQYQNRHAGQRCFLIGNGPSLNKMDLAPLRSEITFGLNRVYLLFPKIGFETSYYVAVNRLVIEQCRDEIRVIRSPKFISWHARKLLGFHPGIYYLRDPYDGTEGFSRRPDRRIWEGATVTFVAMQLAFFMGFKRVILIGVDHNFKVEGKPHEEVTSVQADLNHFDPNYFGSGFRWNLPDLVTSERSYQLAKQAFEKDGREILDATVEGKLTVFPKVDFSSLF